MHFEGVECVADFCRFAVILLGKKKLGSKNLSKEGHDCIRSGIFDVLRY